MRLSLPRRAILISDSAVVKEVAAILCRADPCEARAQERAEASSNDDSFRLTRRCPHPDAQRPRNHMPGHAKADRRPFTGIGVRTSGRTGAWAAPVANSLATPLSGRCRSCHQTLECPRHTMRAPRPTARTLPPGAPPKRGGPQVVPTPRRFFVAMGSDGDCCVQRTSRTRQCPSVLGFHGSRSPGHSGAGQLEGAVPGIHGEKDRFTFGLGGLVRSPMSLPGRMDRTDHPERS